MAHFRAVIKGQRGEASRLGSKHTGITATVDGWTGGVRVIGEFGTICDKFDIYATGGSNGGIVEKHIGHVEDGVFFPSGI